ncbi:MAG: nuclear transport factor 2 family protein [Candidatus Eremiobacterota bacterium]
MKIDEKNKKEVIDVMNRYASASEAKDVDGIMSLFPSDDNNIIIYGSGADEKRIGPEEIKAQMERDFSQADSMALIYDWYSVEGTDNVAWFSADVTVSATVSGKKMTLPARFTTVLEKRNSKWLMVQGHFSIPASGQSEGESFPG